MLWSHGAVALGVQVNKPDKKGGLLSVAHAREGPTLAGCRLLIALRIYSNMSIKRPKTDDMLRCSFSTTQTVEQMLFLPNNAPLPDHPGPDKQKISANDLKKKCVA